MAKVKCRYLPRRPKRPLTGFNLFFRYYYFSAKCNSAKDRWKNRTKLMKDAAKAWNCGPSKIRRIYNTTAKSSGAEYRKEMTKWNSMKMLLKKPSNAYHLFYKDFSKEANGTIPFCQLSRRAGNCWGELDAGTKRVYFRQSARNWRRYCEIQEALEDGASIEDFV